MMMMMMMKMKMKRKMMMMMMKQKQKKKKKKKTRDTTAATSKRAAPTTVTISRTGIQRTRGTKNQKKIKNKNGLLSDKHQADRVTNTRLIV